ncbi:hypothetical protein [Bradyrhizobium sp. 604_D8_N2_3]|uniref:hypothetical protein n=1 Tax=Bradyrhizobium sp. 604_D8_N2_3 TaxID=3240370 RepID=UPI003F27034C
MRILAASLCAALAVTTAEACTVESAVGDKLFASIQSDGDRAKQSLKVLDRLRALNDKGKDPKKPLGEQLTLAEADEFSRLTQRQSAVMLQSLIESAYQRDLKVIKQTFDVANGLYVNGREPTEKDPLSYYFGLLVVLRMVDQANERKDSLSTPAASDCSIEVALHTVERESLEKLGRMDVNNDVSQLTAIQKRSPKGPDGAIDRGRMPYEDRATLERLERKLAPAFREHRFVSDLESLKDLARMAELKYQFQKKDAIDSGGDINSVGQSMDQARLEKRDEMFVRVLKKIADDIPSDWSKEMSAATRTAAPAEAPSQAREQRDARPAKSAPVKKASPPPTKLQ